MCKEDEKVLYNNLIWKFNRDYKYPISIYRDEYSVLIRDQDYGYYFEDYEHPMDPIRLNNASQFFVGDPWRENNPGSMHHPYINFKLRMRSNPDEVSDLYLYVLSEKDGHLSFDTRVTDQRTMAETFALISERLCLNIEKRAMELRDELKQKDETKEEVPTIRERIHNLFHIKEPKEDILHRTKENLFEKEFNLYTYIPPLIKKYMYESKNENLYKMISPRTLIFHFVYHPPVVEELDDKPEILMYGR